MIFNSVVAFRLWGSDPVQASLQKALQGKGTKGDVSVTEMVEVVLSLSASSFFSLFPLSSLVLRTTL